MLAFLFPYIILTEQYKNLLYELLFVCLYSYVPYAIVY